MTALVHPVVVASLVADVLAVLRAVAVSPVLARRWLSFIQRGLVQNGTKRVAPF
jgi:hypothetical protein